MTSSAEQAWRPAWLRFAPLLGAPSDLTRRQWSVLALVSLASLFVFYAMMLFGFALKQIQAGLAIPDAQVGYIGSIVRLGALPAFGVALAADRIGRRRTLLGGIVACALLGGSSRVSTPKAVRP